MRFIDIGFIINACSFCVSRTFSDKHINVTLHVNEDKIIAIDNRVIEVITTIGY